MTLQPKPLASNRRRPTAPNAPGDTGVRRDWRRPPKPRRANLSCSAAELQYRCLQLEYYDLTAQCQSPLQSDNTAAAQSSNPVVGRRRLETRLTGPARTA